MMDDLKQWLPKHNAAPTPDQRGTLKDYESLSLFHFDIGYVGRGGFVVVGE